MAKEAIDKKYLAGLKVKPAEVLDWADKGDVVVIVTTSGQKHRVNKNAAAKTE